MTESESPGKSGTIVVKMHFEKPPEFTVTYKDKDDLYQSFKSQLDKWNTSKQATYWVDLNGDKVKIDDADVLLRIATSGNDTVRVIVRDEVVDSEPEYKEAIEKRKKKKDHKKDRGRNREKSHGHNYRHDSHGRGRSHSRDSSDHEDFHECCGHYPPHYGPTPFSSPQHCYGRMFCPCAAFHFPMNSRFGRHPFFGMGHGHRGHQNDGMPSHFHGY